MFLMSYLCKGLYKGTKLVLVGDIDQLPSVGPGNVLKDIIESERITTITLNKIFLCIFMFSLSLLLFIRHS